MFGGQSYYNHFQECMSEPQFSAHQIIVFKSLTTCIEKKKHLKHDVIIINVVVIIII